MVDRTEGAPKADERKTLEDEARLPWERGDAPRGEEVAVQNLFDMLDSDDPPGEEDTPAADEPSSGQGPDESDVEHPDEDSPEDSDEDAAFEDDEEADEADEEFEDVFAVKVDGDEVEVTLDELLQGYSRQADYTRKTQTLAEERKTLEAELAETRSVRTKLGEYLQALEQDLGGGDQPSDEYWEKLSKQDPAKFTREWAAYQYQQEKLSNVRQAQAALAAKNQEEMQALRQKVVAEERQKLVSAIPDFADEEVMKDEMARIQTYLVKNHGATPEDLANIVDHRFIVMARESMLYREAHDTAGDVVRKGAATRKRRKTLTPGSKAPASRTPRKRSRKAVKVARERLAGSGRVDDAAAVLLAGFDLD